MKPSEVHNALGFNKFLKPQQRRKFFKSATKSQLKPLEEACLNLLKNPSGIKKADLAKVKKYKSAIKTLSNKHDPTKRKRQVLSQRGGFFAALLPILVSLVSSFMQK
jgi:hypothetical protein